MKSLALAALSVLMIATTIVRAAEADNCHVGSYRLKDGSLVDVAPAGDALRWRRFDGSTGALRRDENGKWRSTYGWTG
ncbi:MAG TPA: hypothetical protein VFR59_03050, partial [Steroidobacteraceae bacterium]|nr:hypothetical protein [Steroidobacteraceae bacterium]